MLYSPHKQTPEGRETSGACMIRMPGEKVYSGFQKSLGLQTNNQRAWPVCAKDSGGRSGPSLGKWGIPSPPLSFHRLSGRYENIPRNERICHFCTRNKIEDENHFLLDYKAYSQIRDIFFSKLETKIPDFKSLSHDTLISLLMNSSDYLINCQLVSFMISQCFELRTKLISTNE